MHFLFRATLRLLAACALGAFTNACSYAHVGSGEVGIVRTPNGMNQQVLPTGDWGIGYFDQTTVYNTRSQERAEQLEVLAANGLKIVLDTSVRFHIVSEETLKLDQELGPHYYSVLIGPALRSQARRVVGRYQPEEIYSTQREIIERQIREGVENAIKGRHITLEAILVRNVRLPDVIQGAINNKLEAEQQALKMKFVLAQSQSENERRILEEKAESERKRIVAQGQADALRIDAQARADARRLEGQAAADYQRALQPHLTEQVLRFYQIEALKALARSPNAKLVIIGGSGRAPEQILDLRRMPKTDTPN